jgi:hypothetical protein
MLKRGRCVSCDLEWTDESGEKGCTLINVCPHKAGVRVSIERYLEKHAFAEANYLEDSRVDYETLEEAFTALHTRFGIRWRDLHG